VNSRNRESESPLRTFAEHLARYGPASTFPADEAAAVSYCARLTRGHYENFTVASALLPRRLRRHFFAIYAWCRWADDLGDETGGGRTALDLLDWWQDELRRTRAGHPRHPVTVALRPTLLRFGIPDGPLIALLDAFRTDQARDRWRTFDELLGYCDSSACPVGELVLYLFECHDPDNVVLSDRICAGLQLANFWQDVARDYDNLGRIYLPTEDLERFAVGSDDIAAKRTTPAFAELIRFQVGRTRELLESGRGLLKRLPRDARVDVELFLEGGLAVLRAIESSGYRVLEVRPTVSGRDKLRLLLRAIGRKCLPS